MPKYLDPECYKFVNGAADESAFLTTLPFDLTFFTGGQVVAKKIQEASSRYLTPTVLELGGKNPCIVSRKADLNAATGRITWSNTYNTGQTCLTADFVICESVILDELVEGLKEKSTKQMGQDPKRSLDYGRIVNHHHFDRLVDMLEEVKEYVVFGGTYDRNAKYISPTLIVNPPLDSDIMTEEIFGPILPIITVENIQEAVAFVNEGEKPLALYIFSSDSKEVEYVLHHTSSGGVVVNDCNMHYFVPSLPFGGVGESGKGKYHGKRSMMPFSSCKSIFWRKPGIEFPDEKFRYEAMDQTQFEKFCSHYFLSSFKKSSDFLHSFKK